jgi:hypothetical protein
VALPNGISRLEFEQLIARQRRLFDPRPNPSFAYLGPRGEIGVQPIFLGQQPERVDNNDENTNRTAKDGIAWR